MPSPMSTIWRRRRTADRTARWLWCRRRTRRRFCWRATARGRGRRAAAPTAPNRSPFAADDGQPGDLLRDDDDFVELGVVGRDFGALRGPGGSGVAGQNRDTVLVRVGRGDRPTRKATEACRTGWTRRLPISSGSRPCVLPDVAVNRDICGPFQAGGQHSAATVFGQPSAAVQRARRHPAWGKSWSEAGPIRCRWRRSRIPFYSTGAQTREGGGACVVEDQGAAAGCQLSRRHASKLFDQHRRRRRHALLAKFFTAGRALPRATPATTTGRGDRWGCWHRTRARRSCRPTPAVGLGAASAGAAV